MSVNSLKHFPETFINHLELTPPLPKQLYFLGENPFKLCSEPTVAVVGSRRASAYGKRSTELLVAELASAGVVIVSGLAYGIDSVAHISALEAGGATIAVMPCGLDNIYPASHQRLANSILRNGGALVSEYTATQLAMKHHFIARNRLISAFADMVIVTDAALPSGSLHTAQFALEQGKLLGAVPGDIDMPNSKGTNWLIKQGAQVITEPADVFSLLGIIRKATIRPKHNLSPNQNTLLKLIKESALPVEALPKATGLGIDEVFATLTQLELLGLVENSSGGWKAK